MDPLDFIPLFDLTTFGQRMVLEEEEDAGPPFHIYPIKEEPNVPVF